MTDLKQLESTVLSLGTLMVPDRMLETLTSVQFCKGLLKTIESELEQKLIEYIDFNGPIECGESVWVIGQDKSYKCRNVPQVAEALMQNCGGDWEKFCGCLASGAFKYGSLRTLLEEAGKPELFDQLIETVIRRGVDEKPIRRAKQIDKRFVKPKLRACGTTATRIEE